MQVMVSADDYSGVSYTWKKDQEVVRQITEEEISQQNGVASTDSLWIVGDGSSSYTVEIADGLGNSKTIWFEVSVDNHFTAYPEGTRIRETGKPDTRTTLYAFPGEEVTLRVHTEADDREGITYEWYDDNYERMEEDSDTVTVTAEKKWSEYNCNIKDRYGNTQFAAFEIKLAETFTAYPEGAAMGTDGEMEKSITLDVSADEEVTLRVIAEPEEGIDLTYSWENTTNEEETDRDYVTVKPYQSQKYWCCVTDQYGNYEDIAFDVRVNHFEIRPENGQIEGSSGDSMSTSVYAKEGEKVKLGVKVSGDDTSGVWYSWEKDGAEYETLDEEGSSIEITADYNYFYSCTVYDGLMNRKTITFYITPEEYDAYPENPVMLSDGRKSGDKKLYAVKGEKLTLKIVTEAKDLTGFHYQWYKENTAIEDGTGGGSSLAITADESTSYRCIVTKDGSNAAKYIYFTVIVQGSTAPVLSMNTSEYQESGDVAVYRAAYGEDCTMRVTVKDTGTSDSRYNVAWLDENKKILAEGTDAYTFTVNANAAFYCKVTNSSGKIVWQLIRVKIDNGLEVLPAGRTENNYDSDNNLVQIEAEASAPVTLQAEVSAVEGTPLHYTWQGRAMDFKGDQNSGWQYFDTDGAMLTVTPEADTRYECIVSDGYGNSKIVRFDVLVSDKKDLSRAIIKLLETRPLYTGGPVEPEVSVVYRGQELTRGKDYTVTYFGNDMPNYPSTALVRGTGDFTGKKELSFSIEPLAQTMTVTAPVLTPGTTGKFTVKNAQGYLYYDVISGRDVVTVDSKGTLRGLKVGTAKVLVGASGTLGYKNAEKTITVKVLPAATSRLTAVNMVTGVKLTWARVPGATGYLVRRGGKTIKTITNGATVSYQDMTANKNGTTYNYTIFATSAAGTSKLYKAVSMYRMTRPAFSSVTNSAAKTMKLQWKKNGAVTGYQIHYSLRSDFSNAKSVTITSPATVVRTIKGLVKGKTYYVRIRTYKKAGTAKYYSLWSKTRKITIKK